MLGEHALGAEGAPPTVQRHLVQGHAPKDHLGCGEGAPGKPAERGLAERPLDLGTSPRLGPTSAWSGRAEGASPSNSHLERHLVSAGGQPSSGRYTERWTEEVEPHPPVEAQQCISWDKAVLYATEVILQVPLCANSSLRGFVGEHPWYQGPVLLDAAFHIWALAGEVWQLSRAGVPQSQWRPHMGRFEVKERKWSKQRIHNPEISPEASGHLFWSALQQRLTEWKLAPRQDLWDWLR